MPHPADRKLERLEELSKEAAAASQTFEGIQSEVVKERSRFFERLAILSGSSIALSLTFLGYIQSRPRAVLSHPTLIYASWFCLLGCLMSALLRNLRHQDYFYYVGASSYLEKRADRVSFEVSLVGDSTQLVLSSEGAMMGKEERQDFAGKLGTKEEHLRKEAQRSRRSANAAEITWRVCEYGSEALFFAGLLLLVVFAVVNTG
jgi:hypothetical protein